VWVKKKRVVCPKGKQGGGKTLATQKRETKPRLTSSKPLPYVGGSYWQEAKGGRKKKREEGSWAEFEDDTDRKESCTGVQIHHEREAKKSTSERS